MNSKTKGIIICGTDTDIGKTVVSALLVQGINGTYWKPIQSGLDNGGDTNSVCEILNLKNEQWIPEAYKFKAPVSPHWAAEKEHRLINQEKLKLPIIKGPLIVETAGGLMVPITRKLLQIDQLKYWGLPIVLVAKSSLGTLNHTLLSIEALRKRKLPILGIILNGEPHNDNPKTLEQFSNVPVLAHLPILEGLTRESLAEQWRKQNLAKVFTKYIYQ